MRDCADKRGSADGGFTWVPADAANATRVVDELSLLLTAGRLNANNKQLIAGTYEAKGGGAAGLVAAQELLTLSAEFTSVTANEITEERPEKIEGAATGKPYQALVYIFLNGGADSYNTIVPLENCHSTDLYNEYAMLRTGMR